MSVIIGETEVEAKKRNRKVATATIVGSMLEWYDFYLYATMASIVFGRVFFDSSDTQSATLKAFATFAIGFLARPIGGMFFGYFGDRYGRKQMLFVTFCMMGTCTALIGLIPSYEKLGIWSAVLLVAIRIIQGLGAGAELAGAAVTSYEHASRRRRGRQGAWPALGLNLGLLLSSGIIFILTIHGDDFLLSGGWRIPFLLSIVLVFVGLWVRSQLPETPEFVDMKKEHTQHNTPLKDVFKYSFKGLLVVFFVAIGYNALSYIFKTFSLAYLVEYQHVSAKTTSLSITIASFIAIFTVPAFGWLCDRWSSKAVLATGGILSIAFAYPFMMLLESGNHLLIYLALAIATGILAPMMFAPQGSFLSRQFPVETRSTGVGTGRELGTAIAGGLAPMSALGLVAASPNNSTSAVSLILMCSAIIVVVAVLCDQGKRYTKFKN
ncbi:MFS transporter [uncultured Bartonella sp.]|uniref:MFS transporter n=1 Tax=uncultured Bartonella sp. TaxID=104108 RepID=UPI0025CCC8F6|nr:MFS transporter [uncultured Bartonella sp.]